MTTFFISDLHLQVEAKAITEIFFRFLREQAAHGDALYILGDLFEVWIGDDARDAYANQVCQALQQLSQKTRLFIMQGNRDFLLGKDFIKQCGATLLADPYLIDLYGIPTLLTHGDLLCTADKQYQRLRRWVRSPFLQQLFLSLPLTWRQKIAQRLRQQSQAHVNTLPPPHMDATPEAIAKMFNTYAVNQLIHGHTHNPTIHYFSTVQQRLWRFVLSDWHHHGHVLIFRPDHPPQLSPLG